MKIDIFAHIIPKKYRDRLFECSSERKIFTIIDKLLVNMDDRFRMMDKFEGLTHVLVPAAPALEAVVSAKDAVELARIYNDEVAELVSKYPERFAAAVALLPLSDADATMKEIDRAISDLNLKGILMHSPINCLTTDNDRPLMTKIVTAPEFLPIFDKMAEFKLPIWIHPFPAFRDPYGEHAARWEYRMWQIFGWPFESTIAMTRLVFSGIFDKHPELKIITHHSGAMVPFFESRISMMYNFGETSEGEKYTAGLSKKPVDYFRMFYADTAINGNTAGLTCAHSFFGTDHLLFGTDAPYDSQGGYLSTEKTIEAIEGMQIPFAEKQAIFENNAKRMLHLPS